MLRHVLIGGALTAIITGGVLSTPAQASPICVWADFDKPPLSIPPTCIAYPLETTCLNQHIGMPPLLDGDVHACVPSILGQPAP